MKPRSRSFRTIPDHNEVAPGIKTQLVLFALVRDKIDQKKEGGLGVVVYIFSYDILLIDKTCNEVDNKLKLGDRPYSLQVSVTHDLNKISRVQVQCCNTRDNGGSEDRHTSHTLERKLELCFSVIQEHKEIDDDVTHYSGMRWVQWMLIFETLNYKNIKWWQINIIVCG